MAQTFEQAIKETLGDIVFQAIQLRFDNEQLRAQVARLMPKPKKAKEPADG
jgi:hypothetical protein